jgi:TM2 domain-containing membrane protein YozV
MKKLIRFFLAGTIIFVTVPFSFSQNQNYFHNKSYFSSVEQNNYDSTTKKDSTLNTKKNQKTFNMKKQPWKAVLFSAIIPGAGQFYNQSYWKTPIILGLSIYFGYSYYQQDKTYRSYRDQYSASQTPSNPEGNFYLKAQRELYRNSRDDFLWYFIVVDFINLVDAYVDAQLFDFTVKEDKYTKYGKIDKTYKLGIHLNF